MTKTISKCNNRRNQVSDKVIIAILKACLRDTGLSLRVARGLAGGASGSRNNSSVGGIVEGTPNLTYKNAQTSPGIDTDQ